MFKVYCILGEKMKRISFLFLAIVMVCATLLTQVSLPRPVYAAKVCQCLPYIQAKMGLPATGDAMFPAYKYPVFLENYKQNGKNVFRVSQVSPLTKNPGDLNNLMMIWQPGTQGAYGAGHIAQVRSAKYDSSKKVWTIEFIDANGWTNSAIKLKSSKTEFDCNNVAVRVLTTKSLSGISFYKVSKR